jgi:L-alanine-DL-glutamate epimerase-like enolase superfamily enzyme
MNVRLHRFALPLEHTFAISRESTDVQESLVVELELDGVRGYGESTPSAYYGFTLDSMSRSVDNCRDLLEGFKFGEPDQLWEQLRQILPNDNFALSAIDLAAYDLFGKLVQRPTHEILGLPWHDAVPHSSYTIGIAEIDAMVSKLRQRPYWPIYKIKLGTDKDVEIVRQLRRETNATLRVDANCGWSPEETIANSRELANLGVEFIEQPLPAEADKEDHRRVYNESALPIVADESCQVEEDVERCEGLFHGVNVKLCKCGGLTPAARMLREARSLGMKTMVGCMVESSVGISAAAQLAPLLNFADLDGAVLLAKDIADGVRIENGAIRLPATPGNGVSLNGT